MGDIVQLDPITVGDRVIIRGSILTNRYAGVVGVVRHAADCYGRLGVVPDEPVRIPGKRGPHRERAPVWVLPLDLERTSHTSTEVPK